ncbi:MAG TPA: TolC family protein [Gemmataceae bacterium]|nr:TolC family protein [Gemmataceae bacterium]
MRTICRLLLLFGFLATPVGCMVPSRPSLSALHHDLAPVERVQHRPQLDFAPHCEPDAPASLQEMIAIALKHHPDLRAAQARIEAARGRMIQSGLAPNPMFGPDFGELADRDNQLGEAGARLTATIVPRWKRKLAEFAGAAEVQAADWQAVTRSFDVITRVRLAYFELLTAQRERETLDGIVNVSLEARKAVQSLEKAGVAVRPDVLRANVELEQNQLKREISQRRVEAARQNLLTALGRPPIALDQIKPDPHDFNQAPPFYHWNAMLECLRDNSSELQEARSLIVQTERMLTKVKADVSPNYALLYRPFYASSQGNVHSEIVVQATIPIFDRNQGNIRAAEADIVRASAFEKQLELMLTEKLTNAYQRYQAARKQVETYTESIVPEARESLRLIEAGYKARDKKYDYTAVLQAQQVLFQAELALTQVRGELWRSISEIAGILQQEDLLNGCATSEPPRLP